MVANDRIFGILMIVLAVAYGWGTTQFNEPFGGAEAVGPETFPRLLAVVLALSSLYMIVRLHGQALSGSGHGAAPALS